MPEQPDPAEVALEPPAPLEFEARIAAMEANLNRLNETVAELEARVEDALAKP